MQFIPTMPSRVYDDLIICSSYSDIIFLQTHDVLKNPKHARQLGSRSLAGNIGKIILDNSICELGEAQTAEQIHEAAEISRPMWVIPPDVMRQLDKSVTLWEAFTPPPNSLILPVIQGENETQIEMCIQWWKVHPLNCSDLWGVPKHFGAQRVEVIEKVLERVPEARIHMLGITTPHRDREVFRKYGGVAIHSIDSSKPCAMKESIDARLQKNKYDTLPETTEEFWDQGAISYQMIANISFMRGYFA